VRSTAALEKEAARLKANTIRTYVVSLENGNHSAFHSPNPPRWAGRRLRRLYAKLGYVETDVQMVRAMA